MPYKPFKFEIGEFSYFSSDETFQKYADLRFSKETIRKKKKDDFGNTIELNKDDYHLEKDIKLIEK